MIPSKSVIVSNLKMLFLVVRTIFLKYLDMDEKIIRVNG